MNRIGALLAFALLTFGLVLVMTNPQPVEVNLYFAQRTLEMELGLALLSALGVGLGLATGLGGWLLLRYRLKLSRLQRQYDLVYQEVRNLRRMPIHEA